MSEDREKHWGFPRFAKEFPRHPELDALVDAFANGDYGLVRERAPKLAASTEDEAVKRAAEQLRAAIEPDPTSKIFFYVAGGLLVFLFGWWLTHSGASQAPSPPAAGKPAVTVEKPK